MHAIAQTLIYATALGAALQTALALPTNEPRHVPRAAGQVITACSVPNTIAITFDDGPYKWTRQIVDALNAAGAKGFVIMKPDRYLEANDSETRTFFVNGNNYGCIYDSPNADNIKYAYDQGHQIASHTWAHKRLSTLPPAEIQSEFDKTNDAIEKITGAVPAFMRPPFGAYNSDVVEVAAATGQTVTIWDFDSGDSAGKSASQSEDEYEQLINSKPTSILTLNHETYCEFSNVLLPAILEKLQGKGYKLVTVAECLGENPYISTGTPAKPDASWTC
ncbi:chitin deacetylase [Ceratobasidium sp. AG-Ba]|nr:chitin deacetylase [Ceratobasidium sp. AG-Ba]